MMRESLQSYGSPCKRKLYGAALLNAPPLARGCLVCARSMPGSILPRVANGHLIMNLLSVDDIVAGRRVGEANPPCRSQPRLEQGEGTDVEAGTG